MQKRGPRTARRRHRDARHAHASQRALALLHRATRVDLARRQAQRVELVARRAGGIRRRRSLERVLRERPDAAVRHRLQRVKQRQKTPPGRQKALGGRNFASGLARLERFERRVRGGVARLGARLGVRLDEPTQSGERRRQRRSRARAHPSLRVFVQLRRALSRERDVQQVRRHGFERAATQQAPLQPRAGGVVGDALGDERAAPELQRQRRRQARDARLVREKIRELERVSLRRALRKLRKPRGVKLTKPLERFRDVRGERLGGVGVVRGETGEHARQGGRRGVAALRRAFIAISFRRASLACRRGAELGERPEEHARVHRRRRGGRQRVRSSGIPISVSRRVRSSGALGGALAGRPERRERGRRLGDARRRCSRVATVASLLRRRRRVVERGGQ